MKLMQSWDDRKNRNKDCREIFSRIYEKHDWGGKLKYYSGDGSYNRQVTEPYCDMMKKFISDNHIKSVCDLGCGDFHVASQWITDGISYTGLDVVGSMVSSLNHRFGSPVRGGGQVPVQGHHPGSFTGCRIMCYKAGTAAFKQP